MELPTVAGVFLGGVVTVLTPCCLPMIPPLLSGSVGHRLRPVSIVAGSIVSFTAIGVVVGALGALSPDALRAPAFAVIIVFGAVMADDDLNRWYSEKSSRLSSSAARRTDAFDTGARPIVSAFVLGLVLGVIWLPCVGPVLGAVLAFAAVEGSAATSGFLLFVYGVGFGLPLLGIAYGGKYGGRSVTERLGALGREGALRRFAGYVLIVTGVALLFELDRVFLSWL